mmetsp:Transcript_99964/g.261194  ORF Transcript_99964/g.261194 Transcript_99964/m.261194 type:complete len:206 (-) Transcript_99964:38-655(-)
MGVEKRGVAPGATIMLPPVLAAPPPPPAAPEVVTEATGDGSLDLAVAGPCAVPTSPCRAGLPRPPPEAASVTAGVVAAASAAAAASADAEAGDGRAIWPGRVPRPSERLLTAPPPPPGDSMACPMMLRTVPSRPPAVLVACDAAAKRWAARSALAARPHLNSTRFGSDHGSCNCSSTNPPVAPRFAALLLLPPLLTRRSCCWRRS